MKCLDNDLLIAVLRGKKEERTIVEELDEQGKQLHRLMLSKSILVQTNRKKTENTREATKLLEG
jgi:hypothetical protein